MGMSLSLQGWPCPLTVRHGYDPVTQQLRHGCDPVTPQLDIGVCVDEVCWWLSVVMCVGDLLGEWITCCCVVCGWLAVLLCVDDILLCYVWMNYSVGDVLLCCVWVMYCCAMCGCTTVWVMYCRAVCGCYYSWVMYCCAMCAMAYACVLLLWMDDLQWRSVWMSCSIAVLCRWHMLHIHVWLTTVQCGWLAVVLCVDNFLLCSVWMTYSVDVWYCVSKCGWLCVGGLQ